MTVGVLVRVLPWFLPGLAGAAVVAVATSGAVARRLNTTRRHAVLLVLSAGAVLFATLPPVGDGLLRDDPAPGGTCDFGRILPASPAEYARIGEATLNVALFAPLGLAIGSLRRSPARSRLLAAAAVSPLIIEATQALVPILGRGCQSQDVVDNLLGLGVGLGCGVAAVSAVRVLRRTRRRQPDWETTSEET